MTSKLFEMKRPLLLLAAFVFLSASKCKNDPPPPAPDISGSWKWSCTQLPDEAQLQALSCAQQVPSDSPFLKYVNEYVLLNSDRKSWLAEFAFGTCVDTQEGTYQYTYQSQTKKYQLSFFDASGSLQQTYDVEGVSQSQIRLSNADKTCDLFRSAMPEVKKGQHPVPQNTITWDMRIDGSVSLWSSNAQFPFVYQSPQLQTRVNNPSSYRVEYAVLNTKIDGSDTSHYAAVIQVYNSVTGERLAISPAEDLTLGATIRLEFEDQATHALVQLSGTWLQ